MARRYLAILISLGLFAPAIAQAQDATLAQASRPAATILTQAQRDTYTRAFAALEAGRRDEARQLTAQLRHPLAEKLMRWIDLHIRQNASFEDIARFIDANPDWPNQETLARRAEEALVQRGEDSLVLAWFSDREPTTVEGAVRYVDALVRSGQRPRAQQIVRATWSVGAFAGGQEQGFLARYRSFLTDADHIGRLDHLLWENRHGEARRMLPLVDPSLRLLADARIRLAIGAAGVDAALKKIPDQHAHDPGLAYDRLRWRLRKGQDEAARDILRQPPNNLGRPELWWDERARLARRSLAAGRAGEAYQIARNHQMTPGGATFAEAEFLAGWIALRFTKDARAALGHFTRLYESVRAPVSRARGAYWAARAAEAAGDRAAMASWFQRGANMATTYYGQLAAAKLDGGRPPWPDIAPPGEVDRAAFERHELVRAARLLTEVNEPERVKSFILRLVAIAETPAQHALVGDLSLSLARPDLAVSAAKRSAQWAGVMLPLQGWPIIRLPDVAGTETALILATIRQESAFETDALSPAGARGMMQLMPATAREVAKGLGISAQHHDRRLVSEPEYNIRLGRTYLAGLLNNYGGNYVLSLAAYNAGPGRVQQWLREYGDPRHGRIDIVDWIEMIPFDETRNYVQRVLENLQVYRYRLGPQAANGRTIAQDLGIQLARSP